MGEEEKPVYETIGPYKVLRVLGTGSFAQVSVGQHFETKEMVALKVINTASWNSKNKARRTVLLKREIRLCKLLYHPNIIRMIGTMQDGSKVILVMEHMSGGDLENFTYAQPQGYISEMVARHFFRQIISGIDYLHKNSITHRDIKPANIILDAEQKVPKLIDFGFTNVFDENEKMQSFLGSPHFAAPELLTGTKYSGPLVDVWSLAVTIYACLTGQLPFQANNMEQLMNLIVNADFTFPDHISKDARIMIKKMLCVKTEDRLTVDKVRFEPWMNEGYSEKPLDLSISREEPILNVDETVFKALSAFGYEDADSNMKSLKMNGSNTVKNIYCLILEARDRDQNLKKIIANDSEPSESSNVHSTNHKETSKEVEPALQPVSVKHEKDKHFRIANFLSPFVGRGKGRSKTTEKEKQSK